MNGVLSQQEPFGILSEGRPLSSLPHAALYAMRNKPGANQALLAPFEHAAFAREFAQERPLAAAVSLPFAIPAYTAAKAMGMTNARSPASIVEMGAGYSGLLEGLMPLLLGQGRK